MNRNDPLWLHMFHQWFRPVMAPEDGAGAGAATASATAATPGAGDPPAGAPSAGAAVPWHQHDALKPYAPQLEAKGYTKLGSEIEVIAALAKADQAAAQRLGKPADAFMDRPAKDKPLAEWRRENAAIFGVPEAPDKYDIAKPENWPDTLGWDTGLEQALRTHAHKNGLGQEDVQGLVGMFADVQVQMAQSLDEQAAQANTEMMAELQTEWGDATEANLERARRAAQVLAERAGFGNEGLAALTASLAAKGGDAIAIKAFAALADMMDDDTLVSGGTDAGPGQEAKSAAQAELTALRQPGGAYFEASAKGDTRALRALQPTIDRLTAIVAAER